MTGIQRLLVLACALVGAAQPLMGQAGRSLSLEEALRSAEAQSEAMKIAQAGVLRAQGQQLQARSQYLPQLSGTASYQRTLKSQFEALRGSAQPTPPATVPPVPPRDTTTYFTPCTRYLGGANATQTEKILGLERYASCASSGTGGIDFSKVGFGSQHQYSLGLSGTMTLYSGGRVQAQNAVAAAGRRSADVEVASQRAKLALDVTESYFDAVLADRLVAIAESSLTQTESVLRTTRVARQVGNQSEFDLLRAQVSRDNQMPQVISSRTNRDLAYLRLKQLLNIPYTEQVTLTTTLADDKSLVTLTANELQPGQAPDTSVNARAPVRQVIEALRTQESQLRIAKSEWFPTLTLSSQYGRIAFPKNGVPELSNFLSNWTVSLGASMPLFTGGRTKGERLVAEAGVREAQARVEQTRELAALDAQQALAQLEQSQAALAASMGTAEQAGKAYSIAEVRYKEGISTQIELNDSRILLQQAAANRASAVRNVQVARMRLALLKDLPLGVGGTQAQTFIGAPAGAPATGGGAGSIAPSTGGAGNAAQRAASSAATSTIPQ